MSRNCAAISYKLISSAFVLARVLFAYTISFTSVVTV